MTKSPIISIDAMGGDHGPSVVVPGVVLAAAEAPALRFMLHGDETAITAELAKHPALKDLSLIHI